MPASIPTYFAAQFVKNTNLATRMNTLKKSYQYQYLSLLTTMSLVNMSPVNDVSKELMFISMYL